MQTAETNSALKVLDFSSTTVYHISLKPINKNYMRLIEELRQHIRVETTALVIQPISSDDAKIQYDRRPNSINSRSSLVSKFLVLLDVSIHGIFFVEARWQKTAAKIYYQPYHVCPSVRLSFCPHPPARLLPEGFS
jgi:hypothetical protein